MLSFRSFLHTFARARLRPVAGTPAASPAAAPASASTPAAQACFHCGLPLPPAVHDWVSFDGSAQPVCCAACAAVAAWIVMSGHGDYYAGRARLAAHDGQPGSI